MGKQKRRGRMDKELLAEKKRLELELELNSQKIKKYI
jgi:hypothetical protein